MTNLLFVDAIYLITSIKNNIKNVPMKLKDKALLIRRPVNILALVQSEIKTPQTLIFSHNRLIIVAIYRSKKGELHGKINPFRNMVSQIVLQPYFESNPIVGIECFQNGIISQVIIGVSVESNSIIFRKDIV